MEQRRVQKTREEKKSRSTYRFANSNESLSVDNARSADNSRGGGRSSSSSSDGDLLVLGGLLVLARHGDFGESVVF